MSFEERKLMNQRQKEFYNTKKKNLPTHLWSYLRNGALNGIKKDIGVEKEIYELHKTWFGDLSNKKVLDLGCYEGNSLSLHLAQNAKDYLGIDLSEKGIANFDRRLRNIPEARAVAIDFLSNEFRDRDFDLIYAYGVLHHFKDVDELILKLNQKLKPQGRVISYDPLQTSIPIKILRNLYRPFQSDRDWEWPFSKKTYYKFAEAFEIIERRGVLGKTKYTALINLLPLSEDKRVEKAKKWHRQDWERSLDDDNHMFSCMHLSMLMQKRD